MFFRGRAQVIVPGKEVVCSHYKGTRKNFQDPYYFEVYALILDKVVGIRLMLFKNKIEIPASWDNIIVVGKPFSIPPKVARKV